jgi:hypothetical protein
MWDDLLPPSRAYVIRDVPPYGRIRHNDDVYPRTLRGLLDALAEATYRSCTGTAQEVSAREPGQPDTVIRRYVDGREVPPG